ncbi:MAG TPA: hypothetical protein VFV34_03975, partial [Blastocatellia bacterium]|nr:hypothetical protein [Blastocatellia bacterium]
ESSQAHIGMRQVFWGGGNHEARLYRWESLLPGNEVDGCALLEGASTTYFIPPGWHLTVDGFGNATLRRR